MLTRRLAGLACRRLVVGLLRLLDDLLETITLLVLTLRLHRLHRRLDVR